MDASGEFILPGGLLDTGGVCHREGQLRAMTGSDEQWLLSLSPSLPLARVTTELLARCVRAIGPGSPGTDDLRDLAVGDREFLLLKLRETSFGEALSFVVSCPRPACGALMDLDLRIDEIPVVARSVGASHWLRVGGLDPVDVEFRIPSGRDQEAIASWAAGGAHPDELRDRLLSACILRVASVEGGDGRAALADDARRAVAEAIADRAPGVDTELELVCPECAQSFDVVLDPAALLLEEVRRGRGTFDREIHLLAFHYHWPLRDLLDLTRLQRQRYLRLLLAELGQGA